MRSTVVLFLLCMLCRGALSQPAFPALPGWKLVPADRTYTPDNLFDLIDGAADVYLSFGFVDLHIAEYTDTAGTTVRVELYRHRSPEMAFGIYSGERNTDYHFLPVGAQGYVEEGVLNFLTGMYYVKLTTPTPGASGTTALTCIAHALDTSLHQPPGFPPELVLFPAEGKSLNAESFIGENVLGYSSLHSAFIAEYATPSPHKFFFVHCSTSHEALAMLRGFLRQIGGDTTATGDTPLSLTDQHNGPLRVGTNGRFLFGILAPPNDVVTRREIDSFLRSLRSWPADE